VSHSFKTGQLDGGTMVPMSTDSIRTVFAATGDAVATAIRNAADTPLEAPTPCHDWDLRTLARHFAGTSAAFVRAGQTKALDPEDPWGDKAELDEAGWSEQLAGNVEAASQAWSRSEAWDGVVEGAQLPAAEIGKLALIELLLHGWDVTTAAGVPLKVSEDVGRALLTVLEPTLEQGRTMEVYGPEFEVADDASDFDRALGLSGRDPQWSSATAPAAAAPAPARPPAR
jgi:uncharacterized protein (TIGR03086 family)